MRIHLRHKKKDLITLNFYYTKKYKTFVTYSKNYKGVSGGGVIKLKGLLGTQGIGVNQAKEGSVYKMSLIRVLR